MPALPQTGIPCNKGKIRMHQLKKYFENLGIVVNNSLEENLNIFTLQQYRKGEYFQKENTVCKKIGFLVQGKLRHFYRIEGKDQTRWVSLENNFVTSFASFVSQQPSLDNIVCIEACELLVAPKAAFEKLKQDFPTVYNLWTIAIENEMIGYEHRIFQLITNDAEKRYLDFIKRYPEFIQNVPQKYLASMLGIEPRHLSRIRNKLASGTK